MVSYGSKQVNKYKTNDTTEQLAKFKNTNAVIQIREKEG